MYIYSTDSEVSGEDVLSHSDEESMEPDNYNSAGEEIEEEECDETHVEDGAAYAARRGEREGE